MAKAFPKRRDGPTLSEPVMQLRWIGSGNGENAEEDGQSLKRTVRV